MGERALTYLQGRPAETTATRAHRFAVLQALYVVERWEEARPLAEALVQEDPTNPSYLGYLGVLAARRGDGSEAARISRELADLDRPRIA
jgi:predicted Zn-dependent protease